MPPKKKVKQPEAIQQVLPAPQQNLFRIPKKPFYRSVHLDSDKTVKSLRIKLWKINSLQVKIWAEHHIQDTASLFTTQNAKQKKIARAIAQLKQRAFKNLRRYSLYAWQFRQVEINRLISRSWRLEKVLFNCCDSYFLVKEFVKRSLNPRLKEFFLKMQYSHQDIESLFSGWEYLIDCNVWFQHSLVFNTKNIKNFAKKSQVIENIQGISLPYNKGIYGVSLMDASQLPNLVTLRVNYSVADFMEQPHLDFIKNYPQLTTLEIFGCIKDAPSFEFLGSLPNLKQLALNSGITQILERPKTLPLIHSLEKLKISCAQFSQESLQEFFASNKNLKHLEVEFPLQNDYIIFQETLALPLETLRLTVNVNTWQKDLKTPVRNLASVLSNHKHLKSLYIKLSQPLFSDMHEILLKGLTSMTCLEHLTWFCEIPNELQENKLKDLKKTLIQCPGIQKLELDFGQGYATSKDFSSVLDGLLHLKKLKHLFIKGNFLKITPAAINKFTQFLRSLILENATTVFVHLPGMPLEITKEIDKVIENAEKNNLW